MIWGINILCHLAFLHIPRPVRRAACRVPCGQVYLSSGDIPASPAEPDAASFIPAGEAFFLSIRAQTKDTVSLGLRLLVSKVVPRELSKLLLP